MTTNFVGTIEPSAWPANLPVSGRGGHAISTDDLRRAFVRTADADWPLPARLPASDVLPLPGEVTGTELVGKSKAWRKVIDLIDKVAATDATVLVTGETGCGKEVVARAIHRRSQRASRAFVAMNCAASPRELISSELFGHERGAFTGALQRRIGRFEQAASGTLFLDEIGEVPLETQIALLRVLQEREFERVGSSRPIRTDARVVAATNRDLQAAIADGIFRSDLYYRLNVFPIALPALRERREDIPLLVGTFVRRVARETGKEMRSIRKSSLELLCSYAWPGNVRELQNVVERSMILADGDVFSVDEGWLRREPLPRPLASGRSIEVASRRRAS